MINRPDTRSQRIKRHKRVRAKISGTPERPRLNVFRSETNIYAERQDPGLRFHPGEGFLLRRHQDRRRQAGGRHRGRACQGEGH